MAGLGGGVPRRGLLVRVLVLFGGGGPTDAAGGEGGPWHLRGVEGEHPARPETDTRGRVRDAGAPRPTPEVKPVSTSSWVSVRSPLGSSMARARLTGGRGSALRG